MPGGTVPWRESVVAWPGQRIGNWVWPDRRRQAWGTGYLDVAAELGDLPLPHGAHDGLPHGQLELLANDELHGLAAHPAVIQHGALLITAQSAVVERGLWAANGIRQGHGLPTTTRTRPAHSLQVAQGTGLTQGSPPDLYHTTQEGRGPSHMASRWMGWDESPRGLALVILSTNIDRGRDGWMASPTQWT